MARTQYLADTSAFARLTKPAIAAAFAVEDLDTGVPRRDVQIPARHSDPRTTTRYHGARHNVDRHASYIVTAFIVGAS